MGATLLALDVGERRIGVAVAGLDTKLPRPLTTLARSEASPQDVARLITEQQAAGLVIGLPRGLDGQETAQTKAVQAFAATLTPHVTVPVYWMDEAVTSRQAEEELIARGKPYAKGDIDALSAVYILEDFLREHPEGSA